MYLMAFEKKDGTLITCPSVEEIRKSILRAEATWIETEAKLLDRALACVLRPCAIQIYTDCPQMEIMLDLWLPSWKEKGWKKSDGAEVPEIYQNLAELKEPHEITILRQSHEFASWMETEIAKSRGE